MPNLQASARQSSGACAVGSGEAALPLADRPGCPFCYVFPVCGVCSLLLASVQGPGPGEEEESPGSERGEAERRKEVRCSLLGEEKEKGTVRGKPGLAIVKVNRKASVILLEEKALPGSGV